MHSTAQHSRISLVEDMVESGKSVLLLLLLVLLLLLFIHAGIFLFLSFFELACLI